MLRAAVFDFDGVIVDSEPLHYEAFVSVARGFGIDFTYQEYAQKYIGYDDRDAFRAMLAETDEAPPEAHRVDELGQRKHEHFVQAVARGIRVLPGVLSLIQEISSTMPMAIASGATRRDIDLILQTVGLDNRFDCIVSADDVHRSKPDPESYVLAVRHLMRRHCDLAIAPGNCVAIEDTDAGIRSARSAGLWTVGVAHATSAELLGNAHRVIRSLEEIGVQTLQAWHAEARLGSQA